MRPQFDERDTQILAVRELAFNEMLGPRVGDFLVTPDGMLRFTYDWGDSIQTTVRPSHPCNGDASFYLSEGHVSFSGSLDHSVPKEFLRDTGKTESGSFWFFHHNDFCAENGVYFKIPCRVFEMIRNPS